MRKMRNLAVSALTAAVLLPAAATAQRAPIPHEYLPYNMQSGVLSNLTESGEAVVFEEVVEATGSDWMRVGFSNTRLQGTSYLRLTSLYDNAVQHLNMTSLSQWNEMSAYFNGSQVRVELVAAPGTWKNEVNVDRLVVSGVVAPPAESQCGSSDDREPSSFPERGRLMTIGCSATVITEGSCFLTAGHCIGNGDAVMQFNVPESLSSGAIQNPGPEDQFPKADLLADVGAGVGNDYATFTVSPSSETGLRPYEAYGVKIDIADSIPPLGSDITIVGYGVDGGVRNQTQQIHNGPLVDADFSDALEYQVDTEGGNSGSGVTRSDTGEIVAVHTHAGCNIGSGDGNQGTSVMKPALQDAIALCPQNSGDIMGLEPPSPGLPGTENTWSFEGATPGATVWVIFGNGSGTTPVPGCDGVNMSLANAQPIDNVIADGNGDGSVVRDVPASADGTFYFQAIDMSNCRLSERVTGSF